MLTKEMLTGNTRTTTTGAGPQVALVAQTADRVAVARVATCRAVDFFIDFNVGNVDNY